MKPFTIELFLIFANCTFLCSFVRCSLFYPSSSAYGIFAAIAVPLDLPHRNVFISYNFEANYNLPVNYDIPPFATGIEDEEFFESDRNFPESSCSNCTTFATNEGNLSNATSRATASSENTATPPESRRRRSLLTRTHFYHILKDKFKRSGYKDEKCLLRLICETNTSRLGDNNGVLGSLLHIIFSPSSSANEHLPLSYYQAEYDGANDHCAHYSDDCEENIIDLISAPLQDIVNSLSS